MIRDEFDRLFGDVELPDDAEVIEETRRQRLRLHNSGKTRTGNWTSGMAKSKQGNQCHAKPFMTPSGAFASKKLAADWATANGVNNALGKFDKWVKQLPDQFYYITEQEYNLVKDDEKILGLPWMQNTNRYSNSVNTPRGVFDTVALAAKEFGVASTTIVRRIRRCEPGWSFVNEQ